MIWWQPSRSDGKVRENVNGADDHQRLLARLLNVFFLAVEESKYALTVGNSEDGMHGGLVGQRGIGA
jgi:hypothetical protein